MGQIRCAAWVSFPLPVTALSALLGQDAPNLSAPVIARLKADWKADLARWQSRDLSARRYVYIWADGIHIQARMEENAQCILVIIGATPEGKKELVGFQICYRESTQSWRELLVDLQARGLAIAPELATGDGALGFWKALDEVFPGTRHQRCWVHKIANVLNKLPKSVHKNAKADLAEIWNAPDRASAELALNVFAEKYQAKYQPAMPCLHSSAFLPRTGSICARPTRSKAYSQQCGTEPCAPKAASATPPRS